MSKKKFKVGDYVEVIYQHSFREPKLGERGIVVSIIDDYVKIKFNNKQPLLEDLNGLCILDTLSLKKI